MKRIKLLSLLIIVITLCGCGVRENSNPPTQANVKAAVLAEVHGENVEIDYVEKTEETPRKDIYYFKSKDRNLSFTAKSYIKTIDSGIGGMPIYSYKKSIDVDYLTAVKEYYKQKIDGIFGQDAKNGIGYRFYFHDYDELEEVISKIQEAERIYSEEKNYHNDDEWLAERPLTGISIIWTDGENNQVSLYTSGYSIFAFADPDNTYKEICSTYANKIKSGEIPSDSKLPEKITANAHREKLTKVIINGQEMIDELSYASSVEPSVSIKNVFCAAYYTEFDCYMMRVDPGCGSKSRYNHPLQALVKAAGGVGADKCNDSGSEKWTINGNEYVITADRDKGTKFINSVKLTRNGQEMSIVYTNRSDLTRSSEMILVSVEDIAKMLELNFVVDEENGTLIFDSR